MKRWMIRCLAITLAAVLALPAAAVFPAAADTTPPAELTLLKYARQLYDSIAAAYPTAQQYRIHEWNEKESYRTSLAQAEMNTFTYDTFADISTDLINIGLGYLSGAGGTAADEALDRLSGMKGSVSLRDFIYAQGNSALNAIELGTVEDTMARAEANGGRFASYADACAFLRQTLINRLCFATLRMAKSYYTQQVNEGPGGSSATVSLDEIAGKAAGARDAGTYVVSRFNGLAYAVLDGIGQQVNEPIVTDWINAQKAVVGDLVWYFGQQDTALGLADLQAPSWLSKYEGRLTAAEFPDSEITVSQASGQYALKVCFSDALSLDAVPAGVDGSGSAVFLDAENDAVIRLRQSVGRLSMTVNAYGRDASFFDQRAFRLQWQEYGWVHRWTDVKRPENTLDITSNGNGTLHLQAHFSDVMDFACEIVPDDYEIIEYEEPSGLIAGFLVIQPNDGGSLYLSVSDGAVLEDDSDAYDYFMNNTFVYTTDNPPDLRRYGWTPDEPEKDWDYELSGDERRQLFARLGERTLQSSSGAGAWGGTLKIDGDGRFRGYYYDEDAEELSEVSFTGALGAVRRTGETVYEVTVADVSTAQVPGTEAEGLYGERILYTEAPIAADAVLLLTLPGTPDDAIPEMMRALIGGTYGDWDDYSDCTTLSRAADGWGFFTSIRYPEAEDMAPAETAEPADLPDVPPAGTVVLDDETLTVTALGKTMISNRYNTTGHHRVPAYRLGVYNRRNEDISIKAGHFVDGISYGTVDGIAFWAMEFYEGEDGCAEDEYSDITLNNTIPARSYREFLLYPAGGGHGYSAVEELVNVDARIRVTNVTGSFWTKDYTLVLDEGQTCRRDAPTWVPFESASLAFEIPSDWEVQGRKGDAVLAMLPPPTLDETGTGMIVIDEAPFYTDFDSYLNATLQNAALSPELFDRSAAGLPGRAARWTTGPAQDTVVVLYLTADDGRAISIRVQYESKFQTELEPVALRFLDSLRPVSAGAAPEETAAPADEDAPADIPEDADTPADTDLPLAGDILRFGHYEQDNDAANGPEPIEWRVLGVNAQERWVTMIACDLLDVRPYHTSSAPVTWETSALRAWLNSDFVNQAFSPAEQDALLVRTVHNRPNSEDGVSIIMKPANDTDAGNDTQDRVCLLSFQEASFYLLFDAQAAPTAYALAKGAYIDSQYPVKGRAAGSWWLRSPGKDQTYVLLVNHKGTASNSLPTYTGVGVRPVIRVSLDALYGAPDQPEATAAPTEAPTAEPIVIVTEAPTPTPTAEPIVIITAEPTAAVTETPAPADEPVVIVTEAPTPTPSPTLEPIVIVTAAPAPTAEPAATETEAPTPAPTEVPNVTVTAEPTPTAEPAVTATEAPSLTPTPAATQKSFVFVTATPTPACSTMIPTQAPTATPVFRATAEPTPTATETPVVTATPAPTCSTVTPTQAPTATPVFRATVEPTPTATETPVVTATPAPTCSTVTPTQAPTATPVFRATAEPTPAATETPVVTATPAPTATPVPSRIPTETPEVIATSVPLPATTDTIVTIPPEPTQTPDATAEPSPVPTVVVTPTPVLTPIPTPVVTPTPAPSPVPTPVVTPTPAPSPVPTQAPVVTAAATPAVTPVVTAVPALTPVPTPVMTPAVTAALTVTPTAAPLDAGWIGCWMTRDDTLGELMIKDRADGTLRIAASFLRTLSFEANAIPTRDGRLAFMTENGEFVGTLTRDPSGALYLVVTDGDILDPETEYATLFENRRFVFRPAPYQDLWYEDPEDTALYTVDWPGQWASEGDQTSRINILADGQGGLLMHIMFDSRTVFSGPLEALDGKTMGFEADNFNALLTLNRKKGAILMTDASSSVTTVEDWLDERHYTVVYNRLGRTEAAATATPAPTAAPQTPAPTDTAVIGWTPTAEPSAAQPELPPASTETPAPAAVTLLPIPGKPDYLQVPVSWVTATSYIEGSKDPTAYIPERVIDGDENTVYEFSTKTTKPGKAYLEFTFDAPVSLDAMWMKNGNWRVENGAAQYARNSRPRKITLFVRYATGGDYEKLRTVSLKDDKTRKDWKVIDMPGQTNVIGVRVRIDTIYNGSAFKNDVCISEIMFVKNAAP